jgi:heptosyltransferase-2
MATPFLGVLRTLYPDTFIHLFCRSYVSEIFRRSSAVDEVIEYGPGSSVPSRVRAVVSGRPEGGWSLAFVLPPSFSSALVAFLAGARRRIGYTGEMRRFLLTESVGGFLTREEHLSRMYVRLAERASGAAAADLPLPVVVPPYRWREVASMKGSEEPYAVFAVGAEYGSAKMWPLERYAALAERIAERFGTGIVAVGAAAEAPHIVRLIEAASVPIRSAAGDLRPGELLAVLRGASLVVGNDSGPVHIAAAMGRPAVAIFGSTSPAWTAPRGAAVRIVSRTIDCAPCFRRACPDGDPRCLTGVGVDDVFAAVSDLLEEVCCGEAETRNR